MIDQIEGTLVRRTGPAFYVAAGPLTLEILVPATPDAPGPEVGSVVALWTHLQWKEDGPLLYGFATHDERRLFRLLLQVQGVGPRIALAILAHLPPGRLLERLLAKDEAILTTVPGVGKKTAGRILVELGPQAEKLALQIRTAEADPGARAAAASEDARQALAALGYGAKETERALRETLAEHPGAPVEEQIRLALRKLTQTAGRAGR